MSSIMLKFGDIFKHREKDYVYLAQTDEIRYAALILDNQMSEIFKKRFEDLCKQKASPEISKVLDSRAYCFVELKTEDVKSRLAHFGKTDENALNGNSPLLHIGKLNTLDLMQIKSEIDSGPVPSALKELTKDIIIES